MRLAQVLVIAIERFLQLVEIALGKQREVLLDDLQCASTCYQRHLRKSADLQCEAFGSVACADAGRFETLHQLERDLQFLRLDLQLLRQARVNFFQRLFEVTILVECIDDEFDQRAVAKFAYGQPHLFQQMLTQRRLVRFQLRARVVIFRSFRRARYVIEAPLAFIGGCFIVAAAFEAAFAFVRRRGRRFARGRIGRRRGRRDGAIGKQTHGIVERIVDALEHRIVGQDLFQLLVQFECRQLQQADGLLQLRRERQVLRNA